MPLYEYECVFDGAHFEAFSSIGRRDEAVCPDHGVTAKRLLPHTHTPKGATESAEEALRNEGYDLAQPPTLDDVRRQIVNTQQKLEDTMGIIKQAISPA